MASIMNRLKEFSSSPETPKDPQYDRGFLPNQQNAENVGGIGEMTQDQPVPGQSLTQDPEQKLPYERPPEFTDQRKFTDYLFLELTDPDRLPTFLDVIRNQVPVEVIAQKVLQTQFKKGKISVDLLMLMIEPTMYMIISLASYANIEPIIAPDLEDEDEESRDDMTAKYREAARKLGTAESYGKPGLTVDDLETPEILPENLMSRSKEAVGQVSQVNPGTQETLVNGGLN